MSKLVIEVIRRISSGHVHCAFTDLINCPFHQSRLLCSYRAAQDHMSHDGHIEVVALTCKSQIIERQRLHLSGWDLRDPKFSVDDRGVLWLTAYAKSFNSNGSVRESRNVSWFSRTGSSWSSMHWFGESRWWLWHMVWHNKRAYSLGYQRNAGRLDLFSGHPGKKMQRAKSHVLDMSNHALAFPNETVLDFAQANELWALARRDGNPMTAQLGVACAPYTRWTWRDLGIYIGGPVWLPLTQQTMLVSGRDYDGKRAETKIWLLHKPSAQLQEVSTLPSGGDTSYPGMVIDGDTLYLSYYSSHIDRVARVYLATLSGINALRDVVKEREVSDAGK